MANFFKDNDDLLFYLNGGIDWDPLVQLIEHDFKAPDSYESTEEAVGFYRDVFEMMGEFVAEEIAPYAAEIEHEGMVLENGEVKYGPRLTEVFEKIKGLELHRLSLPRELGGMNGPLMLYMIQTEIVSRADVSVMAHHGFHSGIAMALLMYSVKEGSTELDPKTGEVLSTRFQSAIEEIISGEAWGSMDITEPDAGSDMGALRAKAEQDEDGNWFVTGQKIFITSGHGKYHVVIARTEDAEGLEGLSTFVVPAWEDLEDGTRKRWVTVERLEEKLGHHASATCALGYHRAPAYLVGNRGEGFKQMLLLMNNARIGVGFECIGICEAAIRTAQAYADERRTFGKQIDRHEIIADYFDEMRTDVQALRALAVNAAMHEEMTFRLEIREMQGGMNEFEARRVRREIRRHKRAARRLTPLLKYVAAEKAVEMSRRCVQIHGGAGYTTEYGAEKLLRDAMVMPIYEGTSQIQSLMAMKDTLGAIMKQPQEFVRRLAQTRWLSVSERDLPRRRLAKLQSTSLTAQQHLLRKTVGDKFRTVRTRPLGQWVEGMSQNWDPKRDFAHAMLHAESLTRILVDKAIAELLLEQAEKHPERMDLFERYMERAEPRSRYLLDVITTTGDRMIERLHPELSDTASAAE